MLVVAGKIGVSLKVEAPLTSHGVSSRSNLGLKSEAGEEWLIKDLIVPHPLIKFHKDFQLAVKPQTSLAEYQEETFLSTQGKLWTLFLLKPHSELLIIPGLLRMLNSGCRCWAVSESIAIKSFSSSSHFMIRKGEVVTVGRKCHFLKSSGKRISHLLCWRGALEISGYWTFWSRSCI